MSDRDGEHGTRGRVAGVVATRVGGVLPGPRYFVLAPNYHGATLLALLLSNHPEVVHSGDTNPRRRETWCSCGQRMADCSFWVAVGQDGASAYTSANGKMLPTVPELTGNPFLNTRITALLSEIAIRSSLDIWRLARRPFFEYTKVWEAYRQAALRFSGASLMVDGEKSVSKFLAFRSVEEVEVRLIHLIRDPRAFVHSTNRNQLRRGGATRTLEDVASSWVKGHKNILRAARGLSGERYVRVHYEELAERPDATMKRVFGFMGVADRDVCHPPENAHVFGNRVASSFDGHIQADTAWEHELSNADQQRIQRLSEPLFSRFGYR